MDNLSKKREKPPNPREHANPISALTFSWLLGTFVKGFKRDLRVEDLYEPLKEHRSDCLGDIFESEWEKEILKAKKAGRRPKFLTVIIRVFFWKNVLYSIILAVSELGIRLVQPFLIGLLIRYFSISNASLPEPLEGDATYLGRYVEILGSSETQIQNGEAAFYAAGIVLISFINIFIVHPYMMAMLHQGMKIRVASCSLIYRKALRLSITALGDTTVGQVVNLLSNDVNRFDIAIIFLHYLWIGPVETIIVTYFMYEVFGWATFLGIFFLLLLIPLQGYLGKKMSSYRLRTAIRTDERVRLMNEIINGIQVIKMYTWENPFAKLVAQARKNEIKEIRGASYVRGILLSFIIFSTRFSIFLTVVTYALTTDEPLTADKIFVLTSFYNILRQSMTIFFPAGISQIAEALISITRLQEFLLYDEKTQSIKYNKEDIMNGLQRLKPPTSDIKFDKVTCYWLKQQQEPTLNNISLTIPSNKLFAIIGPVGSGKTSMFQAMLKELPIHSGTLAVNGTVSYASQEPWLFVGTVRQNILFGSDYDRHRYQKVVDVCALKRDFELLPHGDHTMVGERGVSLSGGQRARINLARAVYKDADIYLLDDPLSAVDTHVGKHLFHDCISGYLRHKTVVLVTHQLQHLKNVDRIIILNNGAIEAEGTFDELQKSGLDFAKLLQEPASADSEKTVDRESTPSIHTRRSSVASTISQVTEDGLSRSFDEEEKQEKGSVSSKVYMSYFSSARNWCLVLTMLFSFLLTQIVSSLGDYWGSKWAHDEELNLNNTNISYEEREASTKENIYIYSGISVLTVVITLVRSFLFFYVCMVISRNLHNDMFSNIICAPMKFFNTNPSGRILNRFSKDMGSLDELLPSAMIDCIQIFMALLGIVVIVAVVSPVLLIPTSVIAVIFYLLRIFYLRTSRSIKRLEGISRSPVFSHLNATLQGITTIRAFNAENALIKEFDAHQDLHSTAWYIFISSSRAFGLWLDVFCVIYIGIVTVSFLFWDIKSGADAGLAITQSIALTGMFQWGMRQSAELENQMTSVERVLEYKNMMREPPLESKPDKKPPPSWPFKGSISFYKTYLYYSTDGPAVLQGLTFEVRPQEKIGIVGRTGAGKSSLIAALFRLTHIEGKIIIDSVDTAEIGLHDLRSKISIIPQEPVLFSGTLRKNLDPFDEYPDWVLWEALEEVELRDIVTENAGGLNSRMSEGGTNFSVGQRQLICLARAIIRNNRILIMDEATANVDLQTDNLIQKTIRRKFRDCTVLTIAHRLNTVMDSDRILVLDAGTVVEYDHPYILLKNKTGTLYGMVQQTGFSSSKKLKSIAKKSYKIMLKKEEALKMVQDIENDTSDSSRSSSPEPEFSRTPPQGTIDEEEEEEVKSNR